MKVLNLYAGIGGNRKLWAYVDVTAVEIDRNIAKIYKDFFPDDRVVVADAHQYLLDHYKEFDFIWTSRPCTSHTRARFWGLGNGKTKPLYPDFGLYEEIVFLNHHYKGKWVAENVIPYYKPLIPAQEIGRHLFWSNFYIPKYNTPNNMKTNKQSEWKEMLGFDISEYKNIGRRDKILRNCIIPELGLHIFNSMNNQELKLGI